MKQTNPFIALGAPDRAPNWRMLAVGCLRCHTPIRQWERDFLEALLQRPGVSRKERLTVRLIAERLGIVAPT